MALPTLAKTWQFDINQTITAQGSATATGKAIIFALKESLIGFAQNPWTVRGSSNSVAAGLDSVDRWASTANIVNSSSDHSWIVLRQTGIASNYEVCLDFNSVGNNMTVAVSASAGFTGGTISARPTATDEAILVNTNAYMSGVDTTHQLHVMQSTDGACTRVIVWRGSTNLCTFMLFDKAVNTVTGWTNPCLSIMQAITSDKAITYANLLAGSNSYGRYSGNFTALWTCESNGSSIFPELTNIGTITNSIDNAWSFFPIGIASTTINNRGRHGSIADLWWKPISVSDGDTFPNDANNRQFVAFGPLIFPWTNGSDVPLIT
jgi:hypothetical protein